MRTAFTLFYLLISINLAYSQQSKELDYDVNYDESKVPGYQLPQLLQSSTGKEITNSAEWNSIRRPEILSLFSNLIYGKIPVPADPIQTEYEVIKENSKFLKGLGTRKEVSIRIHNSKGEVQMSMLMIIPNGLQKSVPAFMMISFDDIDSKKMELSVDKARHLNNGLPIEELLDRGYGFVAIYHQDLVKHNDVDFNNAIHSLFYQDNQSFPAANEWSVLAACGYGASLALDYLESDDAIDHTRVVLMGHSKLGKAALWAAARDQRFAVAISANSGCAGAALWRRKYGETLQKMCTRFPYWLCGNAQKFVGREEDLPIDQHMLFALMAPRPVYVATSLDDGWADPRGEYLSAFHAGKVYELFGKKGLEYLEYPTLKQAFIHQEVGFHLREGGHYIAAYDWQKFMEFADYHFK